MKGEEPKPMRTQTLEAEVAEGAMQREKHDYLVGLNHYVPGQGDENAVISPSAPFAHPDNREYNGE